MQTRAESKILADLSEMVRCFELNVEEGEWEKTDIRHTNPSLRDPRSAADNYEKLDTRGKLNAMTNYKNDMIAWFRATCPTSSGSPEEWQSIIDQVEEYGEMFELNNAGDLSRKEMKKTLKLFTPERLMEVWLEDFVLHEFECGLRGYALTVVSKGWSWLGSEGSCTDRIIISCISGIDHC